MLTIGNNYTKPEMSLIFGTKDRQGLDRKLERYGITFEVCGRCRLYHQGNGRSV